MTIAYSPFNISYSARTPLITATEYNSAPTAMDTSNLIPGGSAQAQADALVETIGRASSWCDQYCFGAYGCIAATVETENARAWGSYRNTLLVHPLYWPVVEVRSFSYSPIPGGLAANQAASVTPFGNITIYPQEFEVASSSGVASFSSGLPGFGGFGTSGITRRIEYDIQFTYVAGWPNTTLAASVAAGAASVQPTSVVGIYPGSLMTLYDMPNDESITVASSYVPGASVVPLTAPLQFNHPSTATITNLPPAIKQAAILATTVFIKQRGSGALIAADIGEVTRTQQGFSQNSGSDMDQVKMLLNPFRQAYVGY